MSVALPLRDNRAHRVRIGLVALLVLVCLASVAVGASGVSPVRVLGDLVSGRGVALLDKVVLLDIRLPRLAMGALVGAALAVCGTLLQGLFRNPLADPGIIGISSGASLGAVAAFVLGGLIPGAALLGAWLVPIMAAVTAWATVTLLYRVATRGVQTSVATLLLAGIALAAMASALTGIMVYLADDRQLRDLTFWSMGSLAGASWHKIGLGAVLVAPVLLLAPRLAAGLNALALGEAAAAHMGTDVERLKRHTVLAVAAAAGASVALSGGIGFVGIVVPHLLRLANGPDHRRLLVDAALLGAALLIAADMVARLIVAPAELPIGIVTAILGAPVFLWILMRRRGFGGL
ncbi:FecCD family ABC transporter permease [Paenirhodobacter sp.]|uniref:FecCD family ABC transporter permease n=1 Tax=Paenirhodobacter sp. TaxID=1965326 RepID=UPI003B3ED38C